MPTLPVVLVDTREWKRHWDMSPMQSKFATLRTGDYGVEHPPLLARNLRIERKTEPDFFKCMTQDRDRFERELADLSHFPHRIVIVEMWYSDLIEGNYRSHMDKNAAFGTLMDWWQEYSIGFHFAGTRQHAIESAQRFILKAHEDYALALAAEGA